MEQDQQQLRNLRDFLLVYNRMTEICFQRCTSNLNYRNLTMDEERCVDSCAGKLIRSNHRLMGTYVQLMPGIVQRRLEEMEAKAGEMAKSAEAGAAVETVSTATAALPEGTVAESPSAFASTSVGLVGEIPPITAPPAGGVTDITPVIAPPTGGLTVDIPSVIAPPGGGATVDIPSIIAPPTGGLTVDIPSVIAPPSGGATVDIPSIIAPPTGGVMVDIPPVLAPPTALETVQLPPTLSQAPGEPAAVAVPAFSAKPWLSETLNTLPGLATAPPPIPPPETLPLPPRVDPPSAPGGAQSSPNLGSASSRHDSPAQPPSE
ncbi:mitochondrial import inner membrane translocase subunit Tim10 B [Anguilla anguilla]|uniref:mitochondrial import inner membrane translocase subunit Tim10 B n=1 Tax=Anguilla anguilla TaxID=7936 RepID=UPI0015B072B1|nr:mitochondrial import inner membrane translocase subunit Tim10 B [Anguilla anguilla]